MGDLRIFIYNGVGTTKTLVNDPEKTVDYATGIRYTSLWPKGFGACSFTVPRPVARDWVVKEAQQVIIRDGQFIVFQGRLELKGEQFNSEAETIEIKCSGWYVVLAQRRIRRRWVDRAASRFPALSPNGTGSENFGFTAGEDRITWTMAAGADRNMGNNHYHAVKYVMPAGETIKKLTFNYSIVTDGEGLQLDIFNLDTSTPTIIANVTASTSGTATFTPATPPNSILIQAITKGFDYDTLDSITIDTILVRGLGTVAITAEDVIEDVLADIAAEISSNYDQVADPGQTLDPFVSENDAYETADSIIQRANGFSDSSQNVWGLCVWDETGTSDSKARAVNEARSIADYDYILSLADCKTYKLELAMDEVFNNIYVRYVENDSLKYRTPISNALLADATSIAAYGQRDSEIDIGESTAVPADNYGIRLLSYTKEPLTQAHFKTSQIRTKAGGYASPGRVRAGETVKLLDTGVTYFLRQVDYNDESGEVTMYPDLPPNQLDIIMIQRTLKSKSA